MADVVVDLGCARYAHVGGGLDSVHLLAEKYRPKYLYGFDPLSAGDETTFGETEVETKRLAAWIWDGTVDFVADGVASCVNTDGHSLLPYNMRLAPSGLYPVSCFDLASWLRALDKRVILKMDIEGSEFILLTWLLATGMICYVDILLMEWHDQTRDLRTWRLQLEKELRRFCPVEVWSY